MNDLASGWRPDTVEAIASLPMYDVPELRDAHDALWAFLRRDLAAAGLTRAACPLARGEVGDRAWRDPRLLLSQTCGYPLSLGLRGQVRLVATPGYRARGCQGPYHRSAILVRQADPAVSLGDVRGRRLAINAGDSNTGVRLLRAALARLDDGRPFFDAVIETGAHARSMASLVEGLADVAAVDCVTWAYLERLAPGLCRRLRVLAWSPASPGLPLITGALTTGEERAMLRRSLQRAASDPSLRDVRRLLLLDGFHEVAESKYRALARSRSDAVALGPSGAARRQP